MRVPAATIGSPIHEANAAAQLSVMRRFAPRNVVAAAAMTARISAGIASSVPGPNRLVRGTVFTLSATRSSSS